MNEAEQINGLEPARLSDAGALTDLINAAYRGVLGWTTESAIVGGDRTDVEAIKALIENDTSHLLVAMQGGKVLACVCVEEKGSHAYIGLLAVAPSCQNRGLGKKVLSLAEDYAMNQLHANLLVMVVISQRKELIEYYLRRGYSRTGNIEAYPLHLDVGVPVVEGLTIEALEKHIRRL